LSDLQRRSERWLWGRGVWVERASRRPHHRPRRFQLPAAVGGSTREGTFRIPLDRITTPYGFSFAPDGWHPYAATLRSIEETGPVGYPHSLLRRFHESFQPGDVGQAVATTPEGAHPQLACLPHYWPLLRDLWLLDPHRLRELVAAGRCTAATERSPHVGPFTVEEGAVTYERLLRVHASMREHGYAPERFDGDAGTGFDGYQLDGYFLEDRGDYRFVVLHGHHRLGAAACLGLGQLAVRVRRRYVPVVRPKDLPAFAVASGLPLDALRAVFAQLFETNGAAKRDAWGLG
jgi:hypothetical protein